MRRGRTDARDKNIEKDAVYADLEQAMISAVRKAHGPSDEVVVTIDRLSGDITATRNGLNVVAYCWEKEN